MLIGVFKVKINGVIAMLKRKSPKVLQINDILEWYEKGEIILSPKYQRNSVWNDKAKSYLIDTILRGLPIPPIFVRQSIDVATKKTYREIIDGQQRLRTITEFANDSFPILKSHNDLYGGKKYSDLDDDAKSSFLEYELFAEIINEDDDAVIYDMFARLNTNNCVLNRQELRNAKFWGEFKVAAYNVAAEFREVFLINKIMTDKQMSRMDDVELISILLNLLQNGIDTDTPTSLDKLYEKYDLEYKEFDEVYYKIRNIMSVIEKIYDYLNGNVCCFTSKVYFYTLFAVIFNQMFGINNIEIPRNSDYSFERINDNLPQLFSKIVSFENQYDKYINNNAEDNMELKIEFNNFAKLHKTRTTNKSERIERVTFLNSYFLGD